MLCWNWCHEIKAKFEDDNRFGRSAQFEVKLQRSVQGSPLGNVSLPGADRHSAGSSGIFLPVCVYLQMGSSGPAGTQSDINYPEAWRDIFYRYWVASVFILNARPVLATHCFSWPFLPAINLAGYMYWVHFTPVRLIGGRPPGYSQAPRISSKCL